MTLGRTVLIWGWCLRQRMVAMMLPPKVGRVISSQRSFSVDIEAGAVGGQSGLQPRGDDAGQVAAQGGRPEQQYLRLDQAAELDQRPAVAPGEIVL